MIDSTTLEALAASFERRADEAVGAVEYTRSGYLTRASIGLQAQAIAFETAAGELRALLAPPPRRPRPGWPG